MGQTPNILQVLKSPFQVKLKCLTQAEILLYTGRSRDPTNIRIPPAVNLQIKPCSVKLYKLSGTAIDNKSSMRAEHINPKERRVIGDKDKPSTTVLHTPSQSFTGNSQSQSAAPSTSKSSVKKTHTFKMCQHVFKK